MGKKSAINSLSKIIATITIHKVLLRYTNKPESINHLHYEVIEYRNTAISKTDEFNWNKADKEKIKLNALKHFTRKISAKYKDVKFPIKEAIILLNKTIEEIGI